MLLAVAPGLFGQRGHHHFLIFFGRITPVRQNPPESAKIRFGPLASFRVYADFGGPGPVLENCLFERRWAGRLDSPTLLAAAMSARGIHFKHPCALGLFSCMILDRSPYHVCPGRFFNWGGYLPP